MAKRGSKRCPCSSGQTYANCCAPYHRGENPAEAVVLMRSRFAAFALGDGDYLWLTLHGDHPLRSRPRKDVVKELSDAHRTLRYQGLTIHDHEAHGERAQVLFTARVFERGKDKSFSELSDFERVDGAWRYRDGLTSARSAATIHAFLEIFGE